MPSRTILKSDSETGVKVTLFKSSLNFKEKLGMTNKFYTVKSKTHQNSSTGKLFFINYSYQFEQQNTSSQGHQYSI